MALLNTRHAMDTRTWEYIMLRDGLRCVYCSEFATEVDHVIPVRRGGKNRRYNLVATCSACNSEKGDSIDTRWIATAFGHLAAHGEPVRRTARDFGCFDLIKEFES